MNIGNLSETNKSAANRLIAFLFDLGKNFQSPKCRCRVRLFLGPGQIRDLKRERMAGGEQRGPAPLQAFEQTLKRSSIVLKALSLLALFAWLLYAD